MLIHHILLKKVDLPSLMSDFHDLLDNNKLKSLPTKLSELNNVAEKGVAKKVKYD